MRKTFSDFQQHRQFKQNIQVQKEQQILMKDSLFACKRQKEIFVQKLKKGTLFRLANHLKLQLKLPDRDPYLHWLQQNSTYHSDEPVGERTMGETFFYLNAQDLEKQKKFRKTTLPAIQKFKSTHIQKSSIFDQKIKENRSFCLKKRSENDFTLPTNRITTTNKKCTRQNIGLIQEPQKQKLTQNLKKYCFQNSLSKTQLFPKELNHSFYQSKQDLIKSQFYLNDHKKKMTNQTFYMKQKVKLEPDADLKRVKGFERTFIKPIDQNLKILQKQASLTCYNEVSKYFNIMKGEVSSFIQNHKIIENQRTIDKEQKKQMKIMQQNRPRIALNRLKTVNDQKIQDTHNNNEGHLPQFLLKSLLMTGKKPIMSPQKLSPLKKIRG